MVPLAKLTTLISSGATPLGGASNYAASGEVMLVRSQNVLMGRLELDDVVFVDKTAADKMSRTYLAKGDVLLNITGASIGRVARFDLEVRANVNQHVCVIRANPKVLDHRYLSAFLASPEVQRHIDLQQHGGTRQALTFAQIGAFLVPAPPLPDQRRIADILDNADAVRRKRKEAIALTEELLRSAFLEMFGDPVTNPKGWATRPLGEMSKVTDGTHKTPVYVGSGVPFLSAKNVRAHTIDWTNTRFIAAEEHAELIRRCRPRLGDVLLTKSGTIGEAACVDRAVEFSLFESVALLTVDRASLDPQFVAAMLNDVRVRRLYGADVKGVGVKHLHLVDIRRLPVIAPPLAEQARFARAVDRLRSMKSGMNEAAVETQRLFDALVQRGFRGELGRA